MLQIDCEIASPFQHWVPSNATPRREYPISYSSVTVVPWRGQPIVDVWPLSERSDDNPRGDRFRRKNRHVYDLRHAYRSSRYELNNARDATRNSHVLHYHYTTQFILGVQDGVFFLNMKYSSCTLRPTIECRNTNPDGLHYFFVEK